jgi:hypothetical protein
MVKGTAMTIRSREDSFGVLFAITYPSGIPVSAQIAVEIVAVSRLSSRDERSSGRFSDSNILNEPTLVATPSRGRSTKRNRKPDRITKVTRYTLKSYHMPELTKAAMSGGIPFVSPPAVK